MRDRQPQHQRVVSALSRRSVRRGRPGPAQAVQTGDQPALRDAVADGLSRRYSPEQISHRLRKDFPDDEGMRMSHETIYQALYFQARGGLKREVAQSLRSGRTRRNPHRSPDSRTHRFIDPMIIISDRPAKVADRAVPGHWEGDLIMACMRDFRCVLPPLDAPGCCGRRNCNVNLNNLRGDRPDLDCEPQQARASLAIFNWTRQCCVVLFGSRLRSSGLVCGRGCGVRT